jgi:hypothetical protein
MSIASVVINDVEVAAEKVLGWLGAAGKVVTKVESMEPQVQAALATLLGAVSQAVTDVGTTAANPTITLTNQTMTDLKAVWPDIVAFAASIGIKI